MSKKIAIVFREPTDGYKADRRRYELPEADAQAYIARGVAKRCARQPEPEVPTVVERAVNKFADAIAALKAAVASDNHNQLASALAVARESGMTEAVTPGTKDERAALASALIERHEV